MYEYVTQSVIELMFPIEQAAVSVENSQKTR